jgi:DNA polymerase-3 subunit gamma/tau
MSEAGNELFPQAEKNAGAGYRVLARKYRPADFSALIGQEPMVRTLTNAFASGRIAQAWMLTGVRGVGKTTTARILARALNYWTSEIDRPTVDLSAPGEHCQAIMEGRHVDVTEMDAASHTGIDDIRDIIEQVRYAPVSARYKVFIIDEVHMLSTQAFNGLLKTLEEPPPHVKFIFATTEIRKVPITVLSRCQRFDLRRVDAGTLTGHLARIAGLEAIAVEDEALAMIARAAEGSVRDSLSILDQAIAHAGVEGGPSVTAQQVRAMLGLADRGRVIDLFEQLMSGEVAKALDGFRAQYDVGADPVAVLTDLAEFNHLVTRLRFVPDAAEDKSLSEEERRRGADLAGKLSVRVLSRTWQMLIKGIPEVQGSPRPVSAAEMVLIRIAHAADLPTLDEALKSFSENGGGDRPMPRAPSAPNGMGAGGGSAVSQVAMPTISSGSMGGGAGGAAMRLVEAAPSPAKPVTAAAPAPAPALEPPAPSVPVKSLADIAALADANRDLAFKVLVKRCVRPVKIEPGRLEVSLTDDAPKTLLGDLTTRMERWTGRRWIVSLSREAGGETLAEAETSRRETAISDARSDPAVAALLSRFPGARIIDVRLPVAPEQAASEAELPEPAPDDDDLDF